MSRERHSFSKSFRDEIYAKTKGHCHICGEKRGKYNWVMDHIIPHAAGGKHVVHNYMPACPECNRLRWFYDPSELKQILELGVYLQKEIDRQTTLGKDVRSFYLMRKEQNRKRRIKRNKE